MVKRNQSAPIKAAVSSTSKRKVRLWYKIVEKDDEEEEARNQHEAGNGEV
ncbi:hypothetical protein MGG_16275 [Pyricularia oryzae 70-15]|uniref:Uncharacterized protein n=3 Tax=Pyricularia oryzae TaxID=318829 RepID=G4MQN3_PYRO7|nr:uncharacterized protein MGG_16275 [Pyricularia oryzae 70-15]EHA57320.1 hypothetical protein MGG_16275 [Pyricularia oryzae 70-15]ELQ40593.1 hypothetical protein OOU_Y34scaffold00414g24 [Pyricularia oryzae Y34]